MLSKCFYIVSKLFAYYGAYITHNRSIKYTFLFDYTTIYFNNLTIGVYFGKGDKEILKNIITENHLLSFLKEVTVFR